MNGGSLLRLLRVVAVDVGDELGFGGGVDADFSAVADFGGDGVCDGVVLCVVEVADVGGGLAAGEDGEESGCGGACCGDVDDDGGGVVGYVVASGDLDFGDCVGGAGAMALLVSVEGDFTWSRFQKAYR